MQRTVQKPLRILRTLPTGFFAKTDYATFFAALIAAHRFFVASEMAFRPAALIFRFFLGCATWGGSELFLIPAHLAFWAAAILRREAALNLRLGVPVSDGAAE